jgi:hypothetical protein
MKPKGHMLLKWNDGQFTLPIFGIDNNNPALFRTRFRSPVARSCLMSPALFVQVSALKAPRGT